ncbi:DUF3108 domain-containing protein [Piscinibacter sp. XHJ-5]|uniref:DUF3108 domain-containing protein n=1 Tax=Piscinibacter sp. XHJ-5 TaxID=3037797 RepID=UPI002452BB46|nr:DUF3108 domain-containing protein [Piscinibacter sp. XHJ-5]
MAQRLSLWRTVLQAGEPWQRRVAAIGLILGVIVVHGCIADRLAERMADFSVEAAMPPRIEVAYVREMEPTAPPSMAPAAAAPRPARTKRMRAAAPQPPASAASEVAVAEAAPQSPAPAEAPPEPPATPAVSADAPAAVASAPAPEAAASAPAFTWPGSTRLSYALTGNYRGEVHGSAQVEWVRVDLRYQVHLDVTVGMSFAPLLSRRMTSEGRLTPEGLVPERYDEDSKVAFRERRRATIRFEQGVVLMPDGRRREGWPGVQDAASQFVQLTYIFTTQPQRLAAGQVIEVPLALPRNVDRWLYDVLEQETLYTPFGPVDAFPLKPRRIARAGGDLVAEVWFAPTLAYLPVRIRIRQDAETFVDLMIERKPQLAAQ